MVKFVFSHSKLRKQTFAESFKIQWALPPPLPAPMLSDISSIDALCSSTQDTTNFLIIVCFLFYCAWKCRYCGNCCCVAMFRYHRHFGRVFNTTLSQSFKCLRFATLCDAIKRTSLRTYLLSIHTSQCTRSMIGCRFNKKIGRSPTFVVPNANNVKQMLLKWCQSKTRGYEVRRSNPISCANLSSTLFSTFCSHVYLLLS